MEYAKYGLGRINPRGLKEEAAKEDRIAVKKADEASALVHKEFERSRKVSSDEYKRTKLHY